MNNETKSNPSLIAYTVREVGEKRYWDRIGVAWAHKNGDGYNLSLTALPIDGKITLRVPKPATASDETGGAA